MITLSWWVLALATMGAFVLGQFAGVAVLMTAAFKFDAMRKKEGLGKRYPEGVH